MDATEDAKAWIVTRMKIERDWLMMIGKYRFLKAEMPSDHLKDGFDAATAELRAEERLHLDHLVAKLLR